MTIQSLGVGSGLALDDLVTQLIQAEREPRQNRLDAREETLDAQISALGNLRSRVDAFQDSVDELRSDFNLQGREPTIDNPDESVEPFTAEASNSAVEGDYQIVVEQLAQGSRVQTRAADDTSDPSLTGFTSNSDTVLSSGSGSLTFQVGSTGQSFSVNLSAGVTLQNLRDQVNAASDNFGVNASIINTGTSSGALLVFTSSVTGAGNDLEVVNDNNLAELRRVSTVNADATANLTIAAENQAQNAQAKIDGVVVESSTNTFENTIENVSFEVSEESPLDASSNRIASTLSIGVDKEGLEQKIRDFVENFNSLNTEVRNLTRYGTSELEDDGVFAGDFQVRGLESGLANILTSGVSGSALGSLFEIGVAFNDDGELEIGSLDEFGSGSGEDRLQDALDDNFDEIARLFTDSDEGVAVRLYDFLDSYTSFDGLLRERENSTRDQRSNLDTEREQFELRMLSFEQSLRDRYLNLDQTVARLNQTGNALLASLG